MEREIGIFGSGPAALMTANYLLNLGHDVWVIRPESYVPPRSVYTTSRNTLMFEGLPLGLIKPLPWIRVITSNGTDFRVPVPDPGSYFMIDNRQLVTRLEAILNRQGTQAEILSFSKEDLSGMEVEETKEGVEVNIGGESFYFERVIDATGVGASVVRQVDPLRREEDFLVEYLYGGRFRGGFEKEEMILVFGPAGGTSWACPSMEEGCVDVVYSAWGRYSDFEKFLTEADQRLRILVRFLKNQPGIYLDNKEPEEVLSGMIRSQPTPKPQTSRVYCIGESAGMARPGTGESLSRIAQAAPLLALAIDRGLMPQDFYTAWRRLWQDDFYYAAVVTRLPHQRENNRGRLPDHIGEFYRENEKDRLTQRIEDWVINNRLSVGLAVQLLKEPYILWSLIEVLKNRLVLALKGPMGLAFLWDGWNLPEIDEEV